MKKIKTMPDGKKVCPDKIMVNCDVICCRTKKGVVCFPSLKRVSSTSHDVY